MKRFLTLNLTLITFVFLYLWFRFDYLNEQIPLWGGRPWGTSQLANKNLIFLIPIMMLFVTLVGNFLRNYAKKKYIRYGIEIIFGISLITNFLLTYSALRIVKLASEPFPAIITPAYLSLLYPVAISYLVVTALAPYLIEQLKDRGIVTDPAVHKHPAMLLVKPSTRGGGIIFTLGALVTSLIFVKITPITIGLFMAMILGAILGYMDDIQNTMPKSKFKLIENPWMRLILQALIIIPIIIGGVQVLEFNNPFGGMIKLDWYKIVLGEAVIYPIAIVFTLIWILWIINLLSWSNGVDGQYSGIVGIAALVIAAITLREPHLTFDQKNLINLAAVVAGSSLGLLPYTWHPSKLMWGFGAISAGLAIATLSVLTKAKIAAALIVLAIPFLDGAITVIRRLLQKKSPVKNDRGHLHHILLDMGWPIKKIAIFYWITTLITGLIGIISADSNPMLSALIVGGIIAFIIILINLLALKKRRSL